MVGVTAVAHQRRLLAAQAQDVARHLAVVVLASVFTALGPGAPGLLTQVGTLGERQEGHHQGARQRDHMPGQATVRRGLRRGGAHEVGQASKIGLPLQRQLPARLIVQHILRKARRQLRQLFHDRGVTLAWALGQLRAGAHEVQVRALQQAALLGRQAQVGAARVQRVHAREEHTVGVHGAVVHRHRPGHRALHGLQHIAGGRGREVVEDRGHPLQRAPGAVEGGHGVVKARRRGLGAQRGEFGAVVLHGLAQRGLEVLGLQQRKGRQRVRGCPGRQQWVDTSLVAHAQLPLRMAISSSSR